MKTGTESGKLEWKAETEKQVETGETGNWNGNRKAVHEKLKTGNGRQVAQAINCICACSNDNTY